MVQKEKTYENEDGSAKLGKILGHTSMAGVVLLTALLGGCPVYNVWQQGLAGEAELKRAEQNRKITILEAQSKMEAASLLAKNEIERAKGVAEANKIIGDSLADNEAYLRYLWIQSLDTTKGGNTVVYVPTEGNLPILEASRFKK